MKCKKSYIGESSRSALIRLKEHIYKILLYKKKHIILKDSNYNDSEILYNHFKDSEHDLNLHFRFQIICHDIVNYRNRLETDLIYIFNTKSPSGLNTQTIFKNFYFEPYIF